jgi:hypothetical protein
VTVRVSGGHTRLGVAPPQLEAAEEVMNLDPVSDCSTDIYVPQRLFWCCG